MESPPRTPTSLRQRLRKTSRTPILTRKLSNVVWSCAPSFKNGESHRPLRTWKTKVVGVSTMMERRCATPFTSGVTAPAIVASKVTMENNCPLKQHVCWLGINKPTPEKLAGNNLSSLLLCLPLPLVVCKSYRSTSYTGCSVLPIHMLVSPVTASLKFPEHSNNSPFITPELGKPTLVYTVSKASTCSATTKSRLSSSASVLQLNGTPTGNPLWLLPRHRSAKNEWINAAVMLPNAWLLLYYDLCVMFSTNEDSVAEWLRRWIANPLLFERAGSNPATVDLLFCFSFIFSHLLCQLYIQELLLVSALIVVYLEFHVHLLVKLVSHFGR